MKKTLVLCTAIFLSGCSMDTQKFIPSFLQTSAGHDASAYTYPIYKRAVNVIRDGVTFNDGSYITPKGEGKILLPRGYYFINESGGRILAANRYGDMSVLKDNGQEIAHVKLDAPLVSGATYSGGVVYLLQGNKFGLYDPFHNKITYQKQLKGGSIVDTRLANPLIATNFIALPTLDGKLILISRGTPSAPAAIPIGKTKSYGNIIFLEPLGNKIIAATPSNIIALAPKSKKEIEAKVADITIKNGIIYLLTRDGKVEKLNANLQSIASRQYSNADYATIAAFDGKIYAYAKSGSLVVMDDNLQDYKVYAVGSANDYSYVSGKYLYIDDKKVDLSALTCK
jgi:hypothetical protein